MRERLAIIDEFEAGAGDHAFPPVSQESFAAAKPISVIIVSWNARDYLELCLQSIRDANPSCVREIIVVDNASDDGSPEMVERSFAEVKLIRAGCNLGFARANNLGMEHANGSMFALVNSDALVHPGCLEALSDYLEHHPRAGLAGPRVTGGDGKLQRTSRRLPGAWNTFCRTLALDRAFAGWQFFGGYEVSASEHDKFHEAEVLSGCFWVARREAVRQVGGLDERFFFYGEDIDWCKRFIDTGWELAFVPTAQATHFGGGSSSRAPLRFCIEMLRATLAYWRKHYGRLGESICRTLLVLHHGSRLIARSATLVVGPGRSPTSRQKLEEDIACLRWLLLGLEP